MTHKILVAGSPSFQHWRRCDEDYGGGADLAGRCGLMPLLNAFGITPAIDRLPRFVPRPWTQSRK